MPGFPKYPPLPVPADKVKLICAGDPRLLTEDDRVTERRSAEADELVVLFWAMERDGETYAGLSFRADRLATPGSRKSQPSSSVATA